MVTSIDLLTRRGLSLAALTAMLAIVAAASSADTPSVRAARSAPAMSTQNALKTATPIKHLVIIFGENQSFDHYFGTYPRAANPAGEPIFTAASGTPDVNGYLRHPELLTHNPNTTGTANLATGIAPALMNPFRIDRAQFDTKSQNHAYTPEQRATHNGRMDGFVAYTGRDHNVGAGAFGTAAQVMGYFDGNTVTAMWNYAQHFAMSDNAWTDSFGPSTPGALNVVAGTTNGGLNATASTVPDGQGAFTLINDSDPTGDICSAKGDTIEMAGRNIGDLLNAAGITWGGFMGGFDLTATNANGTTHCQRSTVSPNTGRAKTDYSPHHAWFQYYASTRNVLHTRPSSVAMIGRSEPGLDHSPTPVHHQYDIKDFITAVKAGNFPSVSYLKAPGFQDAHPGNSNPLDEQAFLATTINFLQQQADWKSTAVIILYDDSDGWYDHQAPRVLTSSFDPKADQMTAPGRCEGPGSSQGIGVMGKPVNGRCGPGSRTPFLVISPYARVNYVDHTAISQASVIRFIEDNWLGGRRIGGGSNDGRAGSMMTLFDFRAPSRLAPVYIHPVTGLRIASAPTG